MKVSVLTMLALTVLIILLGPVLLIWSLNTLFPVLNIPVTLETWLAVRSEEHTSELQSH